jgi:trigger factor
MSAETSVDTSVSELPESRVEITVTVPSSELEQRIGKAAGAFAREMRVPGFRKGKVPPQLVLRQVGREAVFEQALRDSLPEWYERAVLDAGITPIGEPKLDVSDVPAEGEPLDFKIEIAVRPEAKLGEYKGIEVGRAEPEIPEGAVEGEIERMRESMASLSPVDRAAASGDHLLIDFTGSVEGDVFEGGQATDYLLELGSDSLIDGFEEGLIGASAGETRNVDVTFPEEYGAENLAGKPAVFEVTVKEVREKQLPELDDDFAADNSDFDTLEELRADIEHRILHAMEHRVEDQFRESVLDAVVGSATIELPDEIVEARAIEVWERVERQLTSRGMDPNMYLQMQGKSREEAIADAKVDAEQGLRREAVLEAVAEAEGIEVTEAELLEALEPPAGEKGKPEKLLQRLRSEGRDVLLVEEIRLRKATDLLIAEAKPIDLDRAEAREKIWTPEEREAAGGSGELWTPGSAKDEAAAAESKDESTEPEDDDAAGSKDEPA